MTAAEKAVNLMGKAEACMAKAEDYNKAVALRNMYNDMARTYVYMAEVALRFNAK